MANSSGSKVCCWILVIVAGMTFLFFTGIAVFVFSLISYSGKSQAVSIEKDSYLVLELSGSVAEYNPVNFWQLVEGRKSVNLANILEALEKAKTDAKICGLILKPQDIKGFASIREIREAVKNFKTSGKPVYAYLEVATDRDYYLASVSDSIVMHPSKSAGLVMLGLGMSSTYWAKTFDKVGLKFNVIHAGQYKGYGENLTADSMSAPIRESLQTLLDGLYETYVTEISQDRKSVTRAVLDKEILDGDKFFIDGQLAVKKGLADLSVDWHGFTEQIKKGEEFEQVSVGKYLNTFDFPDHSGKKVAVLFAEGEISYSAPRKGLFNRTEGIASEDFVDYIRDLAEDDEIGAVVLRVNSPGGSALASELILQELLKLKAKKTLVVSMGNLAASGGYYISCGADKIIAEPNTVTGSIGVVGVIPTAEGLYKKIEARVETVEKGKWAQYIRFDKNLTTEQKAVIENMMFGIYDEFKDRVSKGRNLSGDQVEAVAQGRVWTGKQALDRKLVDEIGTINIAIQRAKELAELPGNASVEYYPNDDDFVNQLLEEMDLSVESFTSQIFLTQEEREIREALRYFEELKSERTFVRAYSPFKIEF